MKPGKADKEEGTEPMDVFSERIKCLGKTKKSFLNRTKSLPKEYSTLASFRKVSKNVQISKSTRHASTRNNENKNINACGSSNRRCFRGTIATITIIALLVVVEGPSCLLQVGDLQLNERSAFYPRDTTHIEAGWHHLEEECHSFYQDKNLNSHKFKQRETSSNYTFNNIKEKKIPKPRAITKVQCPSPTQKFKSRYREAFPAIYSDGESSTPTEGRRSRCGCAQASTTRIVTGGSMTKLPPPTHGNIPIDGKYRIETSEKYYNNPKGARITKASHFNLQYVLGHKIVFLCVARGSPLPHITWFKDGVEIYAHKYMQLHEWTRGHKLKSKMEIDPASQADAGIYECHANNKYAMDSRAFRTTYLAEFN